MILDFNFIFVDFSCISINAKIHTEEGDIKRKEVDGDYTR